jgi:DNA-binding transcriptional ArsR family regulator
MYTANLDLNKKAEREQRAKILAALSDSTRLQIVELLAEYGEMSGSEIAEKIAISHSLLCHHSKILAEAGVIKKRKEGQTTYSALNRELLSDCVKSLLY